MTGGFLIIHTISRPTNFSRSIHYYPSLDCTHGFIYAISVTALTEYDEYRTDREGQLVSQTGTPITQGVLTCITRLITDNRLPLSIALARYGYLTSTEFGPEVQQALTKALTDKATRNLAPIVEASDAGDWKASTWLVEHDPDTAPIFSGAPKRHVIEDRVAHANSIAEAALQELAGMITIDNEDED
jgi:hypothetical protein